MRYISIVPIVIVLFDTLYRNTIYISGIQRSTLVKINSEAFSSSDASSLRVK